MIADFRHLNPTRPTGEGRGDKRREETHTMFKGYVPTQRFRGTRCHPSSRPTTFMGKRNRPRKEGKGREKRDHKEEEEREREREKRRRRRRRRRRRNKARERRPREHF